MSKSSNDGSENLVDIESAMKRLGGDRELFKEFVEIFLEDAPEMMQAIGEGLKRSDATTVEKNAHALKGLISNFGAETCVNRALKLERAGRDGDLSDSGEDFDQLKMLYQNLCSELKEHA